MATRPRVPGAQRSDTVAAPGTPAPVSAARAAVRPVTNPPVAPAPEAAGAADPYVGLTIADRYRVLSKLGEGGMGVVYLAEHVFIEKRVALKVLSEDFARKADLVARFMQEAKAASKIGHENIVDITDFGETSSGSVFFAMEFLDGMDLSGHIRAGGAMPFSRARHIMNQICRALGAAHAKGIIHRDMKPENVYLVTREGKPDFVKILDFGIAKMSSLDEGGSRLTRTGMIFGTPEYMSPEQARGDKPDHRVDIYAAGCILYEMLTGDVPFHAETFMGVLTKHMFENPMPPSQRNPAANIPPDVEAVVMKALAKDRDQRYQSMKELAVALAACAGGDAASAWGNEPSTPGPAPREPSQSLPVAAASATQTQPELPRRRTGLVVGAVVAALALIGGAAAVVLSRHPAAPAPAPAPAPKRVAPAPRPVVAPPPQPVAPPRPSRFTMSIQTQPRGVEVFNGPEILGTTPCKVVLRASEETVELTLKKRGYKEQTLAVVPDKDHDYLVDLQPLPRPHSTAKPAPRPAPTVTPEAPPKPAPPKPAGKLRDLKDPFAN